MNRGMRFRLEKLMQVRPTSITIVSWILIVMGGMTLISTIQSVNNPLVRDLMSRSPLPVSLQFALTYAGLSIMVIGGIGMLKGQNWARLLYVIWSAIGITIGIATSPVKLLMIPGCVFYLIIVCILFRPNANKYFRRIEVESDTESL